MTKPKETPALKMLRQFLCVALSGGIDGAEMREAMEWMLERPNDTEKLLRRNNMCEHENTIKRAEATASRMLGEGDQHAATAIQELLEALAEETEAAENWRRLALQFDHHRMQALGHLKAVVNPGAVFDAYKAAPTDEPVFLQRLRVEQQELDARQQKLGAFIKSLGFRMLSETDAALLSKQEALQHVLLQTLNQRIHSASEKHMREKHNA